MTALSHTAAAPASVPNDLDRIDALRAALERIGHLAAGDPGWGTNLGSDAEALDVIANAAKAALIGDAWANEAQDAAQTAAHEAELEARRYAQTAQALEQMQFMPDDEPTPEPRAMGWGRQGFIMEAETKPEARVQK